jgi:hypothetical protein
VAIAAASLAVFVLPASAQLRKLTLTLLNGQQVVVTVDVAPGTPLDQIKLPPVSSPIVSITDDGSPASSGAPPVTVTGSSGSSGSSGPSGPTAPGPSSGSTNAAPAPLVNGQAPQRTTGRTHRKPGPPQPVAQKRSQRTTTANPRLHATPLRTANGLPTLGNPTLSIALPGPAPVGVPDFFIDKFRIPPFLLPIYTAAGIEYDVPWQVLAAINEIESDYGRDLSVSSAGAIGWMQFLPATWKQYGVDATQSGVKDPYNPVDAIFSAARYLHAAGASKDLRGAIFAYNHASWYVDSVLLRAKLIGGLPPDFVGSLSGLTEGHFPVHAKATYADDLTEKAIQARTAHSKSATVLDQANPSRTGIDIFAKSGSPVVAVQDGEIVQISHSKKLGSFIRLRDAYGNTYTYAQLHQIAKLYPVARPQTVSHAQIASELGLPGADPKPSLPASAGHQPAPAATGATGATGAVTSALTAATNTAAGVVGNATSAVAHAAPGTPAATDQSPTQERLFAHPERPAALAAGGRDQLDALGTGLPGLTSFSSYFTQVFGLKRTDVVLRPLKVGSRVIAGTIIGRVGQGSSKAIAPHVLFEIRPAGRGAPRIDPKPILDGWKLLESTALYRASNSNPFFGPHAKNPTIGQILLMSKEALQRRVLADPNIQIYACGRRDIQAGVADRRVLAVLSYLSASGLKPAVTALRCGQPATLKSGAISDLASGDAVDIAKINGIPVLGHQGPGSITDIAVRRLMALQGLFKPYEIVSLMTYPGTDNTIARKDHPDRVHVGYLPQYDPKTKFGRQVDSVLKPQQWLKLIARLNQIPNPTVTAAPSPYAIPDTTALTGAGATGAGSTGP